LCAKATLFTPFMFSVSSLPILVVLSPSKLDLVTFFFVLSFTPFSFGFVLASSFFCFRLLFSRPGEGDVPPPGFFPPTVVLLDTAFTVLLGPFCCVVEDFLSLGVEGKDLCPRVCSLDSVDIFRFVTGCSGFCRGVGILDTLGFLLRSCLSSTDLWAGFGEPCNRVFPSGVAEDDLRLTLGSRRLVSSVYQKE